MVLAFGMKTSEMGLGNPFVHAFVGVEVMYVDFIVSVV